MTIARRLAPAGLALLLTACGATAATTGSTPAGEAGPSGDPGDRPTTPGALAWLASRHLGPPDSAGRDPQAGQRLPSRRTLGVALRYGAGPGDDGGLLALTVAPGHSQQLTCPTRQGPGGGCVQTARGTLRWALAVPDQDPGMVTVLVSHPGSTARIYWSGDDVTGDPRTVALRFGVDQLLDLAGDARVAPTTTRQAVAAGHDLPGWDDSAGSADIP